MVDGILCTSGNINHTDRNVFRGGEIRKLQKPLVHIQCNFARRSVSELRRVVRLYRERDLSIQRFALCHLQNRRLRDRAAVRLVDIVDRDLISIVDHAGAHEQAQAQEQGCTEDERENAFFHGFVLLSQGVGIGSICVLEVLASTVPTCFHTSLTSLAAYFSRFAVCTASAVT